MHNLPEGCVRGSLVSAFLGPAAQPCKAAGGYGGRRVRHRGGMARCPLVLGRMGAELLAALAVPLARAGGFG